MEINFKQTSTEKRIRAVYLIAFVLLFVSYLTNLYANRQLVKQAQQVVHTNKVIKVLDDIIGKVRDGETGLRGYVISKKVEFLYPYFGAYEKADSLSSLLFDLISDNPQQLNRFKNIKISIDRRFEILRYSLKAFNDSNRQMTAAMILLQPESIKVMDEIRVGILSMEREEDKLLKEREDTMNRTTTAISTITIISLVLAFSLLFFGFITYMQVSKERKRGEQDITNYQDQLKNRIEDLDKVNTELIKMRSLEKFAVTGRIARAIAHEIRNPLTNINLASDQLKTEMAQKDDNTTFLFDMISRNSSRINQLLSDLLNSTKFSELNYEKISANDLLDETLQEAEDRIALNKIKITKKYEPFLRNISVDKAKIKVAFLNLIINAIEAMEGKENRELILETKTENSRCKIYVSDNGDGMDTESVGRLFEAYFTSKPKGNGLGLTNTQNIILNHNGEISVESIKGQGTTFIIILNFS